MFNAFYNAMHAIGYPHPVHATQVHMPIGLVVGAFIFGLLSFMLFRWPKLESFSPFQASSFGTAARFCILAAFLFWFTTVGSAVMDWQHFFAGAMLFPIKVKMGLAGFLFILLCFAIVIGFRKQGMPIILLGTYAIALFTVITLGFFGGEVAYGLRVPKAAKQYQAGQHVFGSHCVGCHPGGSNNIKPRMAIWGSPMLSNVTAFDAWIRHPAPPMPPFPESAISDQHAKDLYEYLNSIMSK